MSDLHDLMRAVDALSVDEVKQLYNYILETRTRFTEVQPLPEKRVMGLHAHLGKAWMSDDFRDELPDNFWLGES